MPIRTVCPADVADAVDDRDSVGSVESDCTAPVRPSIQKARAPAVPAGLRRGARACRPPLCRQPSSTTRSRNGPRPRRKCRRTTPQPSQRRYPSDGPEGTSHSSASQSDFPLHLTPHVDTIGSDLPGLTISWNNCERGWYAIPPVSARVTPRARSRSAPCQVEFDRSPKDSSSKPSAGLGHLRAVLSATSPRDWFRQPLGSRSRPQSNRVPDRASPWAAAPLSHLTPLASAHSWAARNHRVTCVESLTPSAGRLSRWG
jgi:hypothetical protein